MGEIPYRDVVEGAKLFMRIPLEKQLKVIELIIGSAPADVEEIISMITEELGTSDVENIKELLAFTLAMVKSIPSKGPEEVVKDLKHMGFTEANARALVEKILHALPTAEKDAEVLRDLGPEELRKLVETWIDFFTGEYGSMEEWSSEVGLPIRYLVASARFFESMLKSILTGELSPRRLKKVLVDDYGFRPAQASTITEAIEEKLDELSRVLMFKLLYRILDAVE